MSSNPLSWREILGLISPAGQAQLIEFVRQAREQRGAGWLKEVKREYPMFAWLVDLVCNYTADEAYEALIEQYATFPLWMIKAQLLSLHANLRVEIEKPRG